MSASPTNSSLISTAPVQLLTIKDDTWDVNPKALDLLRSLNKPFKVVSIVGTYDYLCEITFTHYYYRELPRW
jgi:hypothetical protein